MHLHSFQEVACLKFRTLFIFSTYLLTRAACKSHFWPADSVAVGWDYREVGINVPEFHISTKHTTVQFFQDAALEEPDVEIQMNPPIPPKPNLDDQSRKSAIIQQLVQVGEALSGGSVDQLFHHKLDFN